MKAAKADDTRLKARDRLAAWLSQRFFVRFHMSLILGFAFVVGLLTTRGFLALGLETMHWRWPLALLASYLAFLLGVRVWLAHVGIGRYLGDRDGGLGKVLDMVDGGGSSGSGTGGGTGSETGGGGSSAASGGGRFGGGGASGSFASLAQAESPALPSVGGGGGGGGGGDLDEGILVVLAIAALLAVIFGAGIYLIWQAPVLLAEAAFEGALAGGLVKSVRRVNDPGWVGGAVRASIGPFLLIFVGAMAIAALAEHNAPEATTLAEAIHILMQ